MQQVRQYNYSDQSQESQIEEQDQEFQESRQVQKYNLTKEPIKKIYQMAQDDQQQQQQQQQEEQQDSSYFEFNQQDVRKHIGIDMKKDNLPQNQQEEDSSDQNSIDYIEERIKKLERDLQERLGKAQIGTNNTKTINTKNISKNSSINPHKNNQRIHNSQKTVENQKKHQTINNIHKKNKPQIPKPKSNLSNSSIPIKQEKNTKEFQKNSRCQNQKQKESLQSNNNSCQKAGIFKKKSGVNRLVQGRQNENINTIDQNIKTNEKPISKKIQPMKKQFDQMQKKIQELTLQNRKLKLKTSHASSTDIYNKKKKPNEDLQKLKQFSNNFSLIDSQKNQRIKQKLDKEIQLLQVLQRLQTKLKGSIKRNMNKLKKNSSTLLHKGVSTGLLNQL